MEPLANMNATNALPENELPENNEKKKSNIIYLLIIVVLTILCGLLSWQFFNQKIIIEKEVKERIVYIEKVASLDKELGELKGEFESMKTNDSKINKELEAKIAQIKMLQQEAAKHKDDAYTIAKLRKETETLRKIMKHFVVQIDSLGRLNQDIILQKNKVAAQLDSQRDRSSELSKQREELQHTVAIGSVLKASNIKVVAVRLKNNKEYATTSAKRTKKIKIMLTLGENRIAKKGERIVYARIVTPDGKEMAVSTDETNTFQFNDSKGYFAAKSTIEYANEETKVTLYTVKSDIPFAAGNYVIDIVTDNVIVGQTTLKLE